MALITNPDVYSLKLNGDGVYEDDIPCSNYFTNIPRGIRCPCNNNYFQSRQNLVSHAKSAIHKKWIETQNTNRNNHYAELETEKKTVREQKIIIAQMQREIAKLEHEKRELLKTIHLITDINRMPVAPSAVQQDIEDLMNFD